MGHIERIIGRLIELVTGSRADALEVEMSKLAGAEKHQVREAWMTEKAKGYIAGAAVAAVMMMLNLVLDKYLPREA
jgi:hypothetical protein